METVLGQSMSPLPMSYKEALERLEQSKVIELANLSKTMYKKLAESRWRHQGMWLCYDPQKSSS